MAGKYKGLYAEGKQPYCDLKKAFGMMEKRLQDRVDFLRNANGILNAEKARLTQELAIVSAENRSLKQGKNLTVSKNAEIVRLQKIIRQKDQDLEICYAELRNVRKDRQALYDMASDSQMYAIAVERLLKAKKDPLIVWPHRPFAVSLKGIKE